MGIHNVELDIYNVEADKPHELIHRVSIISLLRGLFEKIIGEEFIQAYLEEHGQHWHWQTAYL
ncbi:MAG: hypothetical protein ACI9FR_000641 [Cryomorphaceae bacterium]|jgi:hypothetical protein